MTNAQRKNSSSLKTTLIVVVVGIAGYFWGGLTVYERLFPYEQVRAAYYALHDGPLGTVAKPNPRNTIFQTFSPQANVVMIGDSLTADGEWSEMFPQSKIANRGIGRDRADNILLRMDPILAVNPNKAFVMVGINDIGYGQSVDTIFSNYTNIVQQLTDKGITVYIQSTLECSKSVCGDRLDKVRDLNTRLSTYAEQQKLSYININAGLTTEKDGLLKDYTYDGTHLLGSGYLKWSKTIAPYVTSN